MAPSHGTVVCCGTWTLVGNWCIEPYISVQGEKVPDSEKKYSMNVILLFHWKVSTVLLWFLKSIQLFQHSHIVEIRTLVAWLKSTLLLKIECQETHIYMKTECLQQSETHHYFGRKGKSLEGKDEKSCAN